VGLVVGPGEEEGFGGGGDGAREEGEEGGVGYVEGGEEREGVGGVALDAEDWGCGVSCELCVVGGRIDGRYQGRLWPLRPRVWVGRCRGK